MKTGDIVEVRFPKSANHGQWAKIAGHRKLKAGINYYFITMLDGPKEGQDTGFMEHNLRLVNRGEKDMKLKVCNTCGQDLPVPKIKVGDYVRIVNPDFQVNMGQIGIVTHISDYIYLTMLTGPKKGKGRSGWNKGSLEIVHGYIHVDAPNVVRGGPQPLF